MAHGAVAADLGHAEDVPVPRKVKRIRYTASTLRKFVVPGMSKGKTVTFSFAYVFTAEDLEVGKATFRANVEIRGHRDALLADNTAIAPSTVVTR